MMLHQISWYPQEGSGLGGPASPVEVGKPQLRAGSDFQEAMQIPGNSEAEARGLEAMPRVLPSQPGGPCFDQNVASSKGGGLGTVEGIRLGLQRKAGLSVLG